MKTKEFKRAVKAIGYHVKESGAEIAITRSETSRKAVAYVVSKAREFEVFQTASEELAKLVVGYGMTPVELREEEKKYYVKLKNDVLARNMHGNYLNLSKSGYPRPYYVFSNEEPNKSYVTQFTKNQIEEMPDEVKAVLQLCEKIEVTD